MCGAMPSLLLPTKKWFVLSLLALGGLVNGCASTPDTIAIIGGQGDAPYAAVVRSDRSVLALNGLPAKGLTYRVAVTSSGEGIIGGTDDVNAYAALVSPKGELTQIPGLMAPGEIYTVAIDSSGRGIVGGGLVPPRLPL